MIKVLVLFFICSIHVYGDQWNHWGFDYSNTRHNPESNITPENINKLTLKWSLQVDGLIMATPTVSEDGVVYFPDTNAIYAVNGSNGHVIWKRGDTGSRNAAVIWDNDYLLFGAFNATYFALNRTNGHLIWMTEPIDTNISVTQSGVVTANGIFLVGATGDEAGYLLTRGRFLAINASTGHIIWTHFNVPETGYGGAGVWGSSPAIDEQLGLVFIGTGNNYMVPKDVQECLNALKPGETPYLCQAPDNYDDSILAINITNGHIVWNFSAFGVDWFSWPCRPPAPVDPEFCSGNAQIPGYDWDFAQGPMLFKHTQTGTPLVGAGNKGGMFFTLERATGKLAWMTGVGPGSDDGGMLWGSTVDQERIYLALANGRMHNYTLLNGTTICYGSWVALDINTGKKLWQTADPIPLSFEECANFPYDDPKTQMRSGSFGALASNKGLVFGSSEYGTLYALEKATGKIVWNYETKVYSHTGPALVNNWMYWGSGYWNFQPGYMFGFSLNE